MRVAAAESPLPHSVPTKFPGGHVHSLPQPRTTTTSSSLGCARQCAPQNFQTTAVRALFAMTQRQWRSQACSCFFL